MRRPTALTRSVARVPPPELLPERGLLPVRFREAPPVLVKVRVREQNRDHLLAATVPEPESPRRTHAGGTFRPEEDGARHGPDAGKLIGASPPLIVDAQVEVPGAGVDRQVPVERRRLRGRGELDLVGRALDQRSDSELRPVLSEELGEEALDPVSLDRHVVILGRDAIEAALDRPRAPFGHTHLPVGWISEHTTLDRRPPAAAPSTVSARGPRGMAGEEDSAPSRAPRRRAAA